LNKPRCRAQETKEHLPIGRTALLEVSIKCANGLKSAILAGGERYVGEADWYTRPDLRSLARLEPEIAHAPAFETKSYHAVKRAPIARLDATYLHRKMIMKVAAEDFVGAENTVFILPVGK
jgi:hypothetical protein